MRREKCLDANVRTALRYADYVRTIANEEQFKRDNAEIEHSVIAYIQDNYSNLDAKQSKKALDQPMQARRDSQPVPGKFPIVIYAPGSSAAAHDNADLCEYLASEGYIVIASASIGPHTRSIKIDFDSAKSQARDNSFLLGYAETLPQADILHVAAMGYSFGGLANVLAAARDDRISALVSRDGSVRYFLAVVQQASYATPERLALPMLHGDEKKRIVVNAEGTFGPVIDAQWAKDNPEVLANMPDGEKAGFSFSITPVVPAGPKLDYAELMASVKQSNALIKCQTEMMRFLMPTFAGTARITLGQGGRTQTGCRSCR